MGLCPGVGLTTLWCPVNITVQKHELAIPTDNVLNSRTLSKMVCNRLTESVLQNEQEEMFQCAAGFPSATVMNCSFCMSPNAYLCWPNPPQHFLFVAELVIARAKCKLEIFRCELTKEFSFSMLYQRNHPTMMRQLSK
jgi:hypothetical protein